MASLPEDYVRGPIEDYWCSELALFPTFSPIPPDELGTAQATCSLWAANSGTVGKVQVGQRDRCSRWESHIR